MTIHIREAADGDNGALLSIILPIIRTGETYALDPAMSEEEALKYWRAPSKRTFVAMGDGHEVVGTYYLTPNQAGGGAHVCNGGFMVCDQASGNGVARAMCAHALETARVQGYLAMQFNFVVSTNSRAIALWERMGFDVVGRLPHAFRHPREGYIDALVMYQEL